MPILCRKCGAENKDDSQFCQRCGAKLPTKDEDRSGRPTAGLLGTRKLTIVIVILAVVAIAFLLPFFPKSAGTIIPASASHLTTTAATATTTIAPVNVTPTIYNPTYGLTYYGNIEYNQSTVLFGDVAATGNITIESGVVLTTNGSSLLAGGAFTNLGIIDAGNTGQHAALGIKGNNYPYSYGGSGGSGGGGGGHSTSGSNTIAPELSTLLIQEWYANSTSKYLTGAGGGGGCLHHGYSGNGGNSKVSGGIYMDTGQGCTGAGGTGGAGAYGIYIQANRIIAGAINASGQAGASGNPDAGGGGGGGVILLAYGPGGYVAGSYNVGGGSAVSDSGAGGKGLVLNYSYAPGAAPVYLHATPSQIKTLNTTSPIPFPTITLLLAANKDNESSTQSGASVWILPNSMQASIVPFAFIGYMPGIAVNFTSSSQLGTFVNTTGQLYANQCTTGYSESCIVAYMLPSHASNFTITAAGAGGTAFANIELR